MALSRFAPLPLLVTLTAPAAAADLPKVRNVELQPLAAQARRVADALELLGTPLSGAERKALQEAATAKDAAGGVEAIQEVLDKHCLAGVTVSKSEDKAAVRA